MATELITAALHGKDFANVTLLIYKEITRRRVLHGTDTADAVEEIYSECGQAYAKQYKDHDLFDALWTGVEDLVLTIFE
ncbi:MAG TPA: hypothetical protein VF600_09520 [Abditibacteriaceae bacterium]|jgi:hypothetical protein